MAMIWSRMLIILMIFAVAGCSTIGQRGEREPKQLTRIKKTGNGPDEFSVLPTKPLQSPESFSALPSPTPGGNNLVDQNPAADGLVALGARPAGGGIATRDAGLVNYSNRYGADSAIRQRLAAEDREIRTKRGVRDLINLGGADRYTRTYQSEWLDDFREAERLRRLGVTIPSAPPIPAARRN